MEPHLLQGFTAIGEPFLTGITIPYPTPIQTIDFRL
jgi:hypothetical protein